MWVEFGPLVCTVWGWSKESRPSVNSVQICWAYKEEHVWQTDLACLSYFGLRNEGYSWSFQEEET